MRDRLGRLREAANMLRTGAPASQDTAKDTDAEELSVLKLALEDIQRENKRLRDARSALTRQLGPLPISAALIAGLVSAFPGSNEGSPVQQFLVVLALVVFGVMVFLSMRYSALKPYRRFRDEHEGEQPAAADHSRPASAGWRPRLTSPEQVVDEVVARYSPAEPAETRACVVAPGREAAWYAAMIEVERAIRGRYEQRSRWAHVVRMIRPGKIESLQRACDLEWRGLFIVQTLFVAVVSLLIIARLS